MEYTIIETNSSNVKKFFYDNVVNTLIVQYYKKDRTMSYVYKNVSKDVADKLYFCHENKYSIGTFLHQNIKNKYVCEKVDCSIFDKIKNKDTTKKDSLSIAEMQRKQIQALMKQNNIKDFRIKELEQKNDELRAGIYNVEPCMFSQLNKKQLLEKVREYYYKTKELEQDKSNIESGKLEYEVEHLNDLASRFKSIIRYNNPIINISQCDNSTVYLTSVEKEKEAKRIIKQLGLKTPVLTTWSIINNNQHYANNRLIIDPDFMVEFADELNKIAIIASESKENDSNKTGLLKLVLDKFKSILL